MCIIYIGGCTMKEVSKLFLKFKNRSSREESDCKVIIDIIELYYSGNKKIKHHILTWIFKRVENSKTIPVARNILINFLYSIRHLLPKHKKKRFRDFIQKSKTGQKTIGLLKRRKK